MSLNRRAFLATSLTTGLAATSPPAAATRFAAQEPPRNLTRADVPTPALLLDLPAFEANLRIMAEHCKNAGCGFRPHAKTHKCPEVARRQVASGALGVCVATVPEAAAMAAAEVPGILLTSPIVEPSKIARMTALARRGAAPRSCSRSAIPGR
jgi:D-serine deaminase-like pyridoxal phosphate-dependent protein